MLLQPELVPWELPAGASATGHRPATAPGQGAAALCCQVLGAEGSIVSFTVFQERKIHLESDQKIYFDRNEVILSGLDHTDVCICHL